MATLINRIQKLGSRVKQLLTRFLFLLHGVLSLYLLYQSNNLTKIHIIFVIPMICLVVESVVTLVVRGGKEMKFVWPCGFFYILTIVPMVWVLELGLLESRQGLGGTTNGTSTTTTAMNTNTTAGRLQERFNELVYDAMQVSDIGSRKFCELGVIIGLIVGRWLSPRSSLSRNQLSALLLGYVSNAADILELFESLKSPVIVFHRGITVGILGVYTWALLQFAFVSTATANWKKENSNAVAPIYEVVGDVETNSVKVSGKEVDNHSEQGCACFTFKCHPEHFQILITLLMQDGPFLLLRLVLSIQFDVVSELHIFFLCKNAIVCSLLIHRLVVLGRDGDDDDNDDGSNKKTNVIALDD